jgi:hypothetical protein
MQSDCALITLGCGQFAVTETSNSREHGRKPFMQSPAITGMFAHFR